MTPGLQVQAGTFLTTSIFSRCKWSSGKGGRPRRQRSPTLSVPHTWMVWDRETGPQAGNRKTVPESTLSAHIKEVRRGHLKPESPTRKRRGTT